MVYEETYMSYKYGDIIRLKEGVRPQMSLDIETFFKLSDEEGICLNECIEDTDSGSESNKGNNDNNDKIKTYWGLPESAFETDDMGCVYLKSEYAKRLVWGVDDVTRIYDEFGVYEYDRLNINVAFDSEGVVNCGAFCSFVDDRDIVTEECDDVKEKL
jgi:hypothetical protein